MFRPTALVAALPVVGLEPRTAGGLATRATGLDSEPT
jgi:hypothetical protein